MSTAFLQAVLSRFPQARLDIIVRKGFEALPLPHRGEIIPFDKAAQAPGAFGAGLRERDYSHFFVLPPSISSAWMAFRSGVPNRIGYRGGGRGWLLRPALAYRRAHRSVHLIREYLDLLAPWGGDEGGEGETVLPRLAADGAWIARHLPGAVKGLAPYAVLAPGAEFGPAKQWPIPHFAALAAALAGTQGQDKLPVVVTGMAKDREAGDRILADSPGGLNLCGETDLAAVVALVAQSALLVSNDSGAMHIASALQRPQIAVFGSSNPAWTAPLNPHAVVEHLGLPCGPCYKRNCPLGHTDCLAQISPGRVLEHARNLLTADSGHGH